MLVKATDISKRYNLGIRELGRVAEPGEIFEVTEERFKTLRGVNRFKSIFVKRLTAAEEKAYLNKKEQVKLEEEPKHIEVTSNIDEIVELINNSFEEEELDLTLPCEECELVEEEEQKPKKQKKAK